MRNLFQNQHRHTTLTNTRVSDSTATNRQYAMRAVELGHKIISSCEHGYQGRYIEHFELAHEFDLKFLFSAEAYWVKDRFEKDRSNCHIFLAAKNENGRQAINDALSEANITGFYGQPRVDREILLALPENDVWVTSACLAFWKYPEVDDFVLELYNKFKNNFFLEVQYHKTERQSELNKHILQLHNKHKIPIIMGCDSHFIFPGDAQNRTDYLESKGQKYPEEEGWFLDYPDGGEAYERFANQCVLNHSQIEDAIANTNVFLDVEAYDSPCFNKNVKLVSLYPDKDKEFRDTQYRDLVKRGWAGYREKVSEELKPIYVSEIAKEVNEVVTSGTSDYFTVNYEIIKRGKELGGKLTKTGRGSCVSFVTNMLLGFTEVDRIAAPVKMYPERFMTATRILESGSLPDIDFNCADVAPFAQAQVDILGEDHAMPMIAYNTQKMSAAWKLYAKSQNVPFQVANDVSGQIRRYENAVKSADEEDKKSIDPLAYVDKAYHEIFEKSGEYRGVITSWSIAPSAYLLYQGSIRREIGIVKAKDHLCSLMDGKWAEEYKFFKNDLLKVNVVDVIYRCYEKLGMKPPPESELRKQCTPDGEAWSVYKRGCTIGINQVEQVGTSARVTKYAPTNISELCAFVAAIRPGFKSMYRTFENRERFSYGIRAFDELIQTDEMPDSFVLYQEMVMAALNYAGIEMSECYGVIKDISKKRTDKLIAYKERFTAGFTEKLLESDGLSRGRAEEVSHMVWQILEDSGGYSFNASHSYCVSLDSLYCAWLKAHHPLEFYLTYIEVQDDKKNKDKINAAKREAQDYFDIRFPALRFRQDNRSTSIDIENNTITAAISTIKKFGKKMGQVLYEAGQKEYGSFIELLEYLNKNSIKAAVVPLILIDYFSEFGNAKALLRVKEIYDIYGDAASTTLEKIDDEVLISFLEECATNIGVKGNELKTYTFTDKEKFLKLCEAHYLNTIEDFTLKEKMTFQNDIMGYTDITTNRPEDRRKLLAESIYPLISKESGLPWAYAIYTRSVGSGKSGRVTISSMQYDFKPVKEGDIFYAEKVSKNKRGFWDLVKYKVLE